MKKLLLLLIIPLLSFGQKEKKSSITLKSNETIILSELFDFVQHKKNNTKLVKEHTYDLLDEDKLISFDSIYSINDLGKWINWLQEKKNIGYDNTLNYRYNLEKNLIQLPPINESDSAWIIIDGNVQGFQKYYRQLFKSKLIRKELFNVALSIVEDMIPYVSESFYDEIIDELNDLIDYTSITKYYTEGNLSDQNYWKGFIYRRVETDGVPLSEISSYLTEAKSHLINNNPIWTTRNTLYELYINDEIKIGFTTRGYVLTKIPNGNIIRYKKDEIITKITFLEDSTGKYYLIQGFDLDSWDAEEFRNLYDNKLNLIN